MKQVDYKKLQASSGEFENVFSPAIWGQCAGGPSHGRIRGVSSALLAREVGFAPPGGRVGPPVPRVSQVGGSGKTFDKLKKRLKTTSSKLKSTNEKLKIATAELKKVKKMQKGQSNFQKKFAEWMSLKGDESFRQLQNEPSCSSDDGDDDEQAPSGEFGNDQQSCSGEDDDDYGAESGDDNENSSFE